MIKLFYCRFRLKQALNAVSAQKLGQILSIELCTLANYFEGSVEQVKKLFCFLGELVEGKIGIRRSRSVRQFRLTIKSGVVTKAGTLWIDYS